MGLQFLLLGALFLSPQGGDFLGDGWSAALVAIIYLLATTVLLFAGVALRPSLRVSPIPLEGAPLIKHGIYRWFRHPMYLSVALYGIGMTLDRANALSLILLIGLVATLVTKARFEDQLLRERHADALIYQSEVPGIFGRSSKKA